MLNLLTSPSTRRTLRAVLGTVADAVRSVVAPATLVEQTTAPTVVEAPEPAGLFTEDELPPVKDIARAALSFDLASDNARRADRAKRAARKILDRLPSGTYSGWIVERVASNRQTADLDAIRATYKRLGLGQIPMKDAQPSLKVRRAELGAPADVDTAILAAV